MLNLSHRSYKKELLDEKGIPFGILEKNLREIDLVNSLLGGHRVTLLGLKMLMDEPLRTYHIADIGCGNGGTLKRIARWARKKKINVKLTGIDINPEAVAAAQKNCLGYTEIEFTAADYREYLKDLHPPDIIVTTLFCHHLSEEELAGFFRWKKENCKTGFVINDLHRHILAYAGIWLISRLFPGTRLFRNDAPLSVLRGFRKKELEALLGRTGILSRVSWKWAFRYLVVFKASGNEEN